MANRKIRLHRRLREALELPAEAVQGVCRVQLWGRTHMLVENYGGVYEYRAEVVRLKGKAGVLRISGTALVLRELSRERLYIGGDIAGFSYEES